MPRRHCSSCCCGSLAPDRPSVHTEERHAAAEENSDRDREKSSRETVESCRREKSDRRAQSREKSRGETGTGP